MDGGEHGRVLAGPRPIVVDAIQRRPWSLPCSGYDLLSIGPAGPLGPSSSQSGLLESGIQPPVLPRTWSSLLRHVRESGIRHRLTTISTRHTTRAVPCTDLSPRSLASPQVADRSRIFGAVDACSRPGRRGIYLVSSRALGLLIPPHHAFHMPRCVDPLCCIRHAPAGMSR